MNKINGFQSAQQIEDAVVLDINRYSHSTIIAQTGRWRNRIAPHYENKKRSTSRTTVSKGLKLARSGMDLRCP
jgi:hypothetical protein